MENNKKDQKIKSSTLFKNYNYLKLKVHGNGTVVCYASENYPEWNPKQDELLSEVEVNITNGTYIITGKRHLSRYGYNEDGEAITLDDFDLWDDDCYTMVKQPVKVMKIVNGSKTVAKANKRVIDKKENFRKVIDHKKNSGWIHISQLKKVNSVIVLSNRILFINNVP